MAIPKHIKKNKSKGMLRDQITDLLEEDWSKIKDALDEIRETDPNKYIEYYLKMIEFSVPKLRAVDTTINTSDAISNITIEVKKPTLSDEILFDSLDNLSHISVGAPSASLSDGFEEL